MTTSAGKWLCCTAVLSICLLPGCGGGGFGESVAVPEQKRILIRGGLAAGQRETYPGDKPFNIAQAARQSTGDGEAIASASADGRATCKIAVASTGSASAEFQLGQVVFNDTDAAIDVSVAFDCQYEYEIMDRGVQSRTPAVVGLKIFIQDSDEVVLQRRTILEQGDGLGAWKGAGRESPWFNITLQPRSAYNLVLAGKLAVEAEEDGKPVEAKIGVSGLRIDVEAR